MTKWVDIYRREWPRVAAVQAMVLGGVSLLAGSRKTQPNVRALAVMNGMTMCAHQYEEYVDPGYFPGMVNVGIFGRGPVSARNYPFNPNSAMCANVFFRWLYVPPMLFPQVKWLGLPPAMLGIIQGVGHCTLLLVTALSQRLMNQLTEHGIHAAGGGANQLSSIPPAAMRVVGPLLADAFGFAFWVAFGLTAIIFIPAMFLPRHRTEHREDVPVAAGL